METKLYYQDPYIQSFFAKIVETSIDSSGDPFVVLDRTAFYPTGGGQPHDRGTINDSKVINVEEIDGVIRHYLEHPMEQSNEKVLCVIDWERRLDHMQQHAGQHILSAAFDQLFEYKTIGFHLGKDVVTIDLETEVLEQNEIIEAENLANQIILDNRPIETKWVTEEELSQYALRKETKVKEDIRLVIIPDFDYNGCGGTHPHSTGEIRAIKILEIERQKRKIRIQFVCGNRVIEQLQQKQQVLLELTRLLNTPEKGMSTAVTRLLEEKKELEKALEDAKDQLLQYEAKELVANTFSHNHGIITNVYQNRTIQELQKLARLLIAENNNVLVFLVAENGDRLQLVGARGKGITLNLKELITDCLFVINGKGGGNDSFVQGGGEALVTGAELVTHLLSLTKG